MPNVSEDLEELAAVNSEIRFITIELMKLAAERGQSFNAVLREFKQNAFTTKRALSNARWERSRK